MSRLLAHVEDVDWGDRTPVRVDQSPEALKADNARLRRLIVDICREAGVRSSENPIAGIRRIMREHRRELANLRGQP